MSRRGRGATSLSGILLVDKPSGMTSHDVVALVRRATGEGRVGHAGTLDPMATGLLVVLVGPATRLEPYLTVAEKTYEAAITFGAETDTEDADGTVTREAAVPPEAADAAWARRVLAEFVGDSLQQPPAYSAIKVAGRTAHRAARAGESLTLDPRPIRVDVAELRSISQDPVRWNVTFVVSKGTYIRSLARDIGRGARSAAHLGGLRRTRSGTLDVADAHSLEEIRSATIAGETDGLWADPVVALGLPTIEVERTQIADGRALTAASYTPFVPADTHVSIVSADRTVLLAVYRSRGERLVPAAVLADGVSRGRL